MKKPQTTSRRWPWGLVVYSLGVCTAGVVIGRWIDIALIQRQGGSAPDASWLSWNLVIWAILGAALPPVVAGIVRGLKALELRDIRRRTAAANELGLQYSQKPLPYFRRYRALDILLSHTNLDSKLEHHLYGEFKSQPLDVIEYSYTRRNRDSYALGDGDSSETSAMTLVIFPLGEQRLPIFRLAPQTSNRLLRIVLGEPGTVFWEAECGGKPKPDESERPRKHAFHDHYAMTCGYSPTQRKLVEISPRIPNPSTEDPTKLESQVRQLFDESLLQFFVNTHGWHVESSGKYLAVWETEQFVPMDELEGYLLSAMDVADHVRGAWQRPPSKADAVREVEVVSGTQYRSQLQTNLFCGALGACFGLIVSVGITALALRLTNQYSIQPVLVKATGLFLPAALFGLVAGAVGGVVIGAWAIVPTIRTVRRK